MKTFFQTRALCAQVILASTALLAACGPSVLDYRNADVSNGKIYERRADKPFSGSVTNVPQASALAGQPGFAPMSRAILAALGTGQAADRLLITPSFCDIKVKEGALVGDASCTVDQGKIERYQMSFKDGVLHGPFKYFDLTEKNNVVANAKFKEGRLHGEMEIFNLDGQKLINHIEWADGQPKTEEVFSPQTGKRIAQIAYKNGKLDGENRRWAPDGKLLIYSATLVEGVQDGVEEAFYAETGKPQRRTEWTRGKKHGSFEEWDPDGSRVSEAKFEGGRLIEIRSGRPGALGECVDLWIEERRSYTMEMDASRGQFDEWEQSCRAGHRPG